MISDLVKRAKFANYRYEGTFGYYVMTPGEQLADKIFRDYTLLSPHGWPFSLLLILALERRVRRYSHIQEVDELLHV